MTENILFYLVLAQSIINIVAIYFLNKSIDLTRLEIDALEVERDLLEDKIDFATKTAIKADTYRQDADRSISKLSIKASLQDDINDSIVNAFVSMRNLINEMKLIEKNTEECCQSEEKKAPAKKTAKKSKK